MVVKVNATRGLSTDPQVGDPAKLTTVQQVFFHYQEGSLGNHQAYKPYTLVGPPALRLVLDPLAVIFLDNRLYM